MRYKGAKARGFHLAKVRIAKVGDVLHDSEAGLANISCVLHAIGKKAGHCDRSPRDAA